MTNLSVPSVIFADASWYGSLRGGVEVGGGNDASFKDGGSRWGIKGSSEISEGLSAIYRFEHKISTTDASQPGGRLAYAGLSGAFGTVSLGQIWSASFNHVGGITDGSWFYGNSETSYRVGNALSYAMSAGAISMQIDAVMDGGTDTGESVDQLEFGMTVSLGDIGKLGLAYVDTKDSMVTNSVFMEGTPAMVTPGTQSSLTPGTPATLNPGTEPTLNPGTPATLNPGSFPTLNPGTPATLNPGTPATLNPGSFPTLNPGTQASLNEDGVAPSLNEDGAPPSLNNDGVNPSITNAPATVTQVKTLDQKVMPSTAGDEGFDLIIDENGELQVVTTARWKLGETSYKTTELKPGTKKHTVRIDYMDGTVSSDTTVDAEEVMPVVLHIPHDDNGPVAESDPRGSGGMAASGYVAVDGGWKSKACDVEGTTCKPVPAFAVSYRNTDTNNRVVDQDTGNIVARSDLTFLNVSQVTHTAMVEVFDSVTPGEAPNLDPGTQATLNPGKFPTLNPGKFPTLNPGTQASLNEDGVAPSLNEDGVAPSLNEDGVAPSLNEDGVAPSLNEDGVAPSLTPGTPATLDPGTEPTLNPGTPTAVTPGTPSHYDDVTSTVKGSRATHVAAQFSLGAITAYLGYSQNEENGSGMKDKTTHYGISGGLGETGISFHAMARNKDNASGMDSNPWLVGLTKGLGGGATVMVEHGNADDGKSGKTRFGLKVDF